MQNHLSKQYAASTIRNGCGQGGGGVAGVGVLVGGKVRKFFFSKNFQKKLMKPNFPNVTACTFGGFLPNLGQQLKSWSRQIFMAKITTTSLNHQITQKIIRNNGLNRLWVSNSNLIRLVQRESPKS